LKEYHPDFPLQSVCPYPALESDIKRSMEAEPVPSHLVASASARWVDVCTTLVADTRTFTVKRFRLRRKIPAADPQSHGVSQENESPSTPYSSLLTSQISDTTPFPSIDSSELEHEFIEEPVMDLDGTLVDAVERVIARSGPSSAVHSRATSPSRLRRGKSGLSETTDSQNLETPAIEVPRRECRRMVLGALEEVVRSVAAERHQEPGPTSSQNRGCPASSGYTDNTLREGVRKWLLDIEEAC
jgi:hypothetical protein